MAEAGEFPEPISDRLTWVDFPWVDIEVDYASRSFDLSKCPASEPPRKDTEVATTADREAIDACAQDTDGVFSDLMITAF